MNDSNDHSDPDDPQGVGRRGVLGALGLGAGASLLGAGQWLASQAAPATRLTALLSGANQVPPLSSSGTGTATITENDDGTLDYRVTVVGLEGITQAHIHEGGAGENGPVVADLFRFTENIDGTGEGFPRTATAEDPVVESGTIEDTELVSSILESPENYYVNVHTLANPAGEIRDQLSAAADAVTFSVRIENVSTEETLMPPEGDPQAVPLSPGAFAVYPTAEPPEPAVTETPAMGNATEVPGDETATETEGEATETEAVIEPMADMGTKTETPGVVTGRPEDGTETPGMETAAPATETPGMATETPGVETETPGVETETPEETPTPTPEGTPTPVPTPTVTPASPTVANPIFTPGEFERGNGLEQIAEDGDPGALDQSLAASPDVAQSGVFNTPVDAESPGPIGPGGAYEFAVTATPDQRLTFATMFIPSNDLFFAPGAEGISLFDGGEPVDGDVTDQVALWDAGTEVNEPPGVGPNQAPRQDFPDQGTDEGNRIRLADAVPDGFTYPATSEVVSVTITPTTAEAATETPEEEEEEEEPATETPAEEEEPATETPAEEEEPATETPEEEEPATETPEEEEPATETPESGDGGSGDDGY